MMISLYALCFTIFVSIMSSSLAFLHGLAHSRLTVVQNSQKSISTRNCYMRLDESRSKSFAAVALSSLIIAAFPSISISAPAMLNAGTLNVDKSSVSNELKSLLSETKYSQTADSKKGDSSNKEREASAPVRATAPTKLKTVAPPTPPKVFTYQTRLENKSSTKPSSSKLAEEKEAKDALDKRTTIEAEKAAELNKLKESINRARYSMPTSQLPAASRELRVEKGAFSQFGPKSVPKTTEEIELERIKNSKLIAIATLRNSEKELDGLNLNLAATESTIKLDQLELSNISKKLQKVTSRPEAVRLETEQTNLKSKLGKLLSLRETEFKAIRDKSGALKKHESEVKELEVLEKKASNTVAQVSARRLAQEKAAKLKAESVANEKMKKEKAAMAKSAETQLKLANQKKQAAEQELKLRQSKVAKLEKEATQQLVKVSAELAKTEETRKAAEKTEITAKSRETQISEELQKTLSDKNQLEVKSLEELKKAKIEAKEAEFAASKAEKLYRKIERK